MIRLLLSLIRLPLVVPLVAVQRLAGAGDDRDADEERPPGEHPTETEHGDEEQTREQPDSAPAESDTGPERDEEEEPTSSEDEPAASADQGSDGGEGSDGDGEGSGQDESSDEIKGDAPAAPSLGVRADVEKMEREKAEHRERLAEKELSREDAMGLDKRRKIVGGTYGPTKTRLIATFSITIAIIAAIGVGLFLLVGELDQAPKGKPAAEAPWSAADAPSRAPKRIQ